MTSQVSTSSGNCLIAQFLREIIVEMPEAEVSPCTDDLFHYSCLEYQLKVIVLQEQTHYRTS